MTWYKKAAALGETPAMFKLGEAPELGIACIGIDRPTTHAAVHAGMILWKGLLGQPRNPRDGLTWLKRAAEQADENNQHALHELVRTAPPPRSGQEPVF